MKYTQSEHFSQRSFFRFHKGFRKILWNTEFAAPPHNSLRVNYLYISWFRHGNKPNMINYFLHIMYVKTHQELPWVPQVLVVLWRYHENPKLVLGDPVVQQVLVVWMVLHDLKQKACTLRVNKNNATWFRIGVNDFHTPGPYTRVWKYFWSMSFWKFE